MQTTDQTQTKLLQARTGLMFSRPFFGSLAVQLTLVEKTDDQNIDTLATDGESIFYNPDFIDKLTPSELEFACAHEVMHVALEHHVRRSGRDMDRWKRACDYAINGMLISEGMNMPAGGLHDPQFDGMTAEAIYELMPANETTGQSSAGDGQEDGSTSPGNGSSDPGQCGDVLDAAEPHELAKLQAASSKAKMQVRQAVMLSAKNQIGDSSNSMKRMIDALLKPVIDWRTILREFIDESTTRDYSWSRPNRRYLHAGLILPGTVADGVPHIVVAVDTSISIDLNALNRFAAEIRAAFEDGAVDKVTVIYADTRVQSVETFESGEELTITATGGGGTSFADTFEWIAANADDASAVIYFTDLEVRNFGLEPSCPVLWAVYGNGLKFDRLAAKAPFGTALELAA
jgi:predicted metal-dependent peptidase